MREIDRPSGKLEIVCTAAFIGAQVVRASLPAAVAVAPVTVCLGGMVLLTAATVAVVLLKREATTAHPDLSEVLGDYGLVAVAA